LDTCRDDGTCSNVVPQMPGLCTDACTVAVCTEADGFVCVPREDCADSDPCTVDVCTGGECVHTPKDCDDHNVCTADSCSNGECVNYENPSQCDDKKVCTTDICNADVGCTYTSPSPVIVPGSMDCLYSECDPSTPSGEQMRWVQVPTGECPEISQCKVQEDLGCQTDRANYLSSVADVDGQAPAYKQMLARVFGTKYVANSLVTVDPMIVGNYGQVWQFKVSIVPFNSQSTEVASLLRESCIFFGYHPSTADKFLQLIFTAGATQTTVRVQFIFPVLPGK